MSNSPYSIVFLPYNSSCFNVNYGILPSNPWVIGNQPHYAPTPVLNNGYKNLLQDPMIQLYLLFRPQQPQTNILQVSNCKFQQLNKILEKGSGYRKNSQDYISPRCELRKEKQKKKYIQNPKRNVITNLGNQLLALLGNKYKLNEILRKFPDRFQEELVSSMLIYINEVRKAQNSYLSVKKMRDIWYPPSVSYHLDQVIELFRKVSYFYLTNHVHLQLVKSVKMREETKIHHLRGIKSLVNVLRNPPKFYNSMKGEQ